MKKYYLLKICTFLFTHTLVSNVMSQENPFTYLYYFPMYDELYSEFEYWSFNYYNNKDADFVKQKKIKCLHLTTTTNEDTYYYFSTNGKLSMVVDSGKYSSHHTEKYGYNQNNELITISVNDTMRIYFFYNKGDLIKNAITNAKKDTIETYHYLYDKNGRINEVNNIKKGDIGHIWNYIYEDTTLTVLKDEKENEKIVFDSKNRILYHQIDSAFIANYTYIADKYIFLQKDDCQPCDAPPRMRFAFYHYDNSVLTEFYYRSVHASSAIYQFATVKKNNKGLVCFMDIKSDELSSCTKFEYFYY